MKRHGSMTSAHAQSGIDCKLHSKSLGEETESLSAPIGEIGTTGPPFQMSVASNTQRRKTHLFPQFCD
jgi:hypothetical protein